MEKENNVKVNYSLNSTLKIKWRRFVMLEKLSISTMIIALFSALFGGWASSYFQFKIWKRTEKNAFMWEFRLKLHEAEKDMWLVDYPAQLNSVLSWIEIAVGDPRMKIDKKLVSEYISLIRIGWTQLKDSKEQTSEPMFWGISANQLELIRSKREEIDQFVVKKASKLKI